MRYALLIAVLLLYTLSYAQVSNDFPDDSKSKEKIWVVETSDGNIYRGKVVEWTTDAVILETVSLGEITIPKTEIVAIEEADRRDLKKNRLPSSISNMRYRHANKYILTPTAYGLEKGNWYYQNQMLFFNQINYGITDNVTVGVGAIPFPLFTPIWGSVKVAIPVVEDQFNVSVNALVGGVTYTGAVFGLVYANATLGPPSSNINAGVGYGFVQNEWTPVPTFVLSGKKRVGEKFHLISENFVVVVDGSAFALLSIGGRAGFEKTSFDFAFYLPTVGSNSIFPIPVLGIGIPIGPATPKPLRTR